MANERLTTVNSEMDKNLSCEDSVCKSETPQEPATQKPDEQNSVCYETEESNIKQEFAIDTQVLVGNICSYKNMKGRYIFVDY